MIKNAWRSIAVALILILILASVGMGSTIVSSTLMQVDQILTDVLTGRTGSTISVTSNLNATGYNISASRIDAGSVNTSSLFWNGENRTDMLAYLQMFCTFLIYTDGTNYYAKNCTSGQISFSLTNSTLAEQIALGNTTSGTVLLKDVAFNYNLTVPVNVSVTESLNGATRKFINIANNQSSPYTISVDTIFPGYYLAQDSQGSYINSWTSTDATTTISNATSQGGTIVFGKGLFTLQTTLYINKSIDISGQYNDTVIKIAGNKNIYAFTVNLTAQVKIHNLLIDGNKANEASGGDIYAVDVNNCTFKDNIIVNAKDNGIFIDTSALTPHYNEISGNIITGFGTAGIRLYTNHETRVIGNQIQGPGISVASTYGILTRSASIYEVVEGNTISSSYYGINADMGESSIGDNHVKDTTIAIYLYGALASSYVGNQVDGSYRESYYIDADSNRNIISGGFVQGGLPVNTYDAFTVLGHNNTITGIVVNPILAPDWQFKNGFTVSGNNNIISACTANGQGGSGVSITGNGTTITGSNFNSNGVDGIKITNAFRTIITATHSTFNVGYGVNETGTSDYTLFDGNILLNNTAGNYTVDAANSVLGENIG